MSNTEEAMEALAQMKTFRVYQAFYGEKGQELLSTRIKAASFQAKYTSFGTCIEFYDGSGMIGAVPGAIAVYEERVILEEINTHMRLPGRGGRDNGVYPPRSPGEEVQSVLGEE